MRGVFGSVGGGIIYPTWWFTPNSSPDGINWIISDPDKYIYETKEKITKDGLYKTRLVHEGDLIF